MRPRADGGEHGGARPADPLIDEVREWRRILWERFGGDPARVYAHLREFEKAHAKRLVRASMEGAPPKTR